MRLQPHPESMLNGGEQASPPVLFLEWLRKNLFYLFGLLCSLFMGALLNILKSVEAVILYGHPSPEQIEVFTYNKSPL